MYKKITIVLMLSILFFSVFFFTYAQESFLNPDISKVGFLEFLSGFYGFAIMISGVLAVGMIVVGGIYITLSGASPDKKSEGKKIILSAIWGLALVLSSYLILKTINPRLVELENPGGQLEQADFELCASSSKVMSENNGIKISKGLPACGIGEWPINFETGECQCYVDTKWIESYSAFGDRIANEEDPHSTGVLEGSIQSKGRGCFLNTFGQSSKDIKSKLTTINCAGIKISIHELAKNAYETACSKIQPNTKTKCGTNVFSSGVFVWRHIDSNPNKPLSLHSFGIASDWNAWDCGMCDYKPRTQCSCKSPLPDSFINAFKSTDGFRWGGDYKNKCDNMHFEWLGPCAK